MSIAFEQVSYSYHIKPKKKNKKELSSQEAATWGNTSDALWALQDISLTINDGEFFGIAGHTGSGKSTLIQHMNGIIKPTTGRVLVDGEDIADKKTAAAQRMHVGLVMQYPEHQLFATTIYDDVGFGPRNLGLSSNEVDARVRQAFEQVLLDFDGLKDKSPFELSGGQQRRVALAGVLAMQPSTLVLDEPAAGLDPHTRKQFLSLIAKLHTQGLTVVMVSHDMESLARLSDRILVLNQGQQYLLGNPEEVFSDAARLHDIGLDVPLAQRFAHALKQRGVDLNEPLYNSETLAQALAQRYSKLSR